MKIVSAQDMQELDRKAIASGIPGSELMERAGRGVFDAIREEFPDQLFRGVVIVCGKGNNGGDGFVVARHCHKLGIPVTVFLLSAAEKLTGDARKSFEHYSAVSGQYREIQSEAELSELSEALRRAGVIVDALLGTGLSSPVSGLYRAVIDAINAVKGCCVVAVDVPSGVDATSGAVLGAAVHSHMTCTFGLPKRGLVNGQGATCAGKIIVIDIGIPPEFVEALDVREYFLTREDLVGALPSRSPHAHKGTFGHVLVIAGSPGMTGAAALAGQAALRTGAGLVTVAVPETLNAILETKLTEVMTLPLPDAGRGFFCMDAVRFLTKNLDGKNAVIIGPGLSRHEETQAAIRAFLADCTVPMVIDADGLNAVACDLTCLARLRSPAIVTPHPGEMARLMRCATAEVQRDRIGCSRKFATDYGVLVVLKGALTVIAAPDGSIFVNPTGNPGMATGGMGDALTGMIGGLIAQSIEPVRAAQLATFVHGSIGDLLARERAPLGILASDIIERIPAELWRCSQR